MPTVRDVLKGEQPDQDPANKQAEELGEGLSSVKLPGAGDGPLAQAELMAERLRFAADQRAALAQNEINRLQTRVSQLQEHMQELTKQGLPPGPLAAHLDETMQRLDDAQADLARAHEAKQNTEFATSLRHEKIEHHEMHEPIAQSMGSPGVPKVSAVLGHSGSATAGATKLGPKIAKGFKR